jgi:hypothetical protein
VIVVSGRVRNDHGEAVAAGVDCPDCGGPLRPWGFARPRLIRSFSSVSSWRPRRAICGRCSSTHVLLPAELLPRRRDDVAVIGAALVAHAGGAGHRRIAIELDRPPSTVRNWLRGFRGQAERLLVIGTRRYCELDPLAPPAFPTGSTVGDAVEALGRAARAAALRFGPYDPVWVIINIVTAGRLITRGPLRQVQS